VAAPRLQAAGRAPGACWLLLRRAWLAATWAALLVLRCHTIEVHAAQPLREAATHVL
jgi:hypothetical protein